MAGDSGKQTQKGSSTTKMELPAWYSGHLQNAANQGRDLYSMYTNQWYNGQGPPSLYIPPDVATTQGLSLQEQLAQGGSPVAGASQAEWLKTLRGDYASPDSNPWLRELANRAGLEAEQRINTQYAQGGASGGGAYANALADAQTQARTQLYAGNYEQERQRQMQALGMSPVQEALAYSGAERLQDVGAAREADLLRKQQEANRQRDYPFELLSRYTDTLYGSPSQREGTQTSTEKITRKSDSPFNWASFINGIMSSAGGS